MYRLSNASSALPPAVWIESEDASDDIPLISLVLHALNNEDGRLLRLILFAGCEGSSLTNTGANQQG